MIINFKILCNKNLLSFTLLKKKKIKEEERYFSLELN